MGHLPRVETRGQDSLARHMSLQQVYCPSSSQAQGYWPAPALLFAHDDYLPEQGVLAGRRETTGRARRSARDGPSRIKPAQANA